MTKLPSGTTARATEEWVGATPDSPIPERVRLRIVIRQHGKCALTGVKFGPKAAPKFDHIVALADGGLHRESNLQAILADAHRAKTADEAAVRAKVRAAAKAHIGIKTPSPRPMQSRNDLQTRSETPKTGKARIERVTPPRRGGIAAQYRLIGKD